MRIFYGTSAKKLDVTEICRARMKRGRIVIPGRDMMRNKLFSDPLPGVRKFIFVQHDETETVYGPTRVVVPTLTELPAKLETLHKTLTLKYGRFAQELPEQKMAVLYLTGNEKVLEIGGNIGRNSMVIASILERDNLVTLESDPCIAKQLIENRDANRLSFHVEVSALSSRPLIQRKWNTIPSEVLLPGYTWVNTITWPSLKAKYNINFDTLVLDCEGAFYYILMDIPEILTNINLVIMENDYTDLAHKTYVDEVLMSNGFKRDYVEAGGWGVCKDRFFEVWKKVLGTF